MTGIDPRLPESLALDLPTSFVRHSDDPAWLRGLPDLLDRLAARWSLTLGPHFSGLSYNYVAPATRADGTPCVLKVGRHDGELRTEMEALRLWDGRGAAQLLAADPEVGALLLERLVPGTMLVEVAERDDDAATRIAADLLRQLWRPAPEGHALRSLRSWFAGFDRCRAALRRGERGFPAAVFERADALLAELLATAPADVILHGDHHHFNILTSQRPDDPAPQWRVIDPKGLVGDPCFDICQFLFNPGDETPSMIARRVDIFTAELGLDRPRTKRWCFLWAILQACWDFEDSDDAGWKENLGRADFLLAL
jgi:streptomycin 6-kinase